MKKLLLTTALLALASFQARADVAKDTSAELLMKDISVEQVALINTRPPRSSQPPAVKIWVDRKNRVYPVGSEIVIGARATKDGYLTLISKGSSGKTIQLLPNAEKRDNFIRAGQTVHFPIHGKDTFVFRVNGPRGKELIKAFFSQSPSSIYGKSAASFSDDFFPASDAPVELISKDISVELARPERQGWDAAEVVIDIGP